MPKVHPNSAAALPDRLRSAAVYAPLRPYACLRLLIDLALAPLRDRAAVQAELLVLHHQVRVLERHVKVVHWRQADRLVLAALARGLPRPSWSTLLVKPETVLRWHRELYRGLGRQGPERRAAIAERRCPITTPARSSTWAPPAG